MRHRSTLIEYAASHIQHMQKALTLMNVQLNNVIRDLTGDTGMKIVRAIVEGERDPAVLAQHRDYRCKSSEDKIRESLIGNYQEDHMFCLKQALELYDHYSLKITECDQEIEKIMSELKSHSDVDEEKQDKKTKKKISKKHRFEFDMHRELIRITGVDLTQIPSLNVSTVAKVISEIGLDMSKWKTSKHFASWLGVCPGTKVSGGRRLSGKTAPSTNSLRLSDSALGAFFRRISSRIGFGKAIVAAAHKLAVILYNMLKTGTEYMESGAGYYEEHYRDRCINGLLKRAKHFGLTLVACTA
jgi:transposase